jgi:hypothetical protein
MSWLVTYFRSEKWFLLKIIIPVLLAFFFAELVLVPLGSSIKDYQIKYDHLNRNIYSEEWLRNRDGVLNHKLSQLEIANDLLMHKIVANADSLYTLHSFRRLAEARGLSVSQLDESVRVIGKLREHTIRLNFGGSYNQFIQFLRSIEQNRASAFVYTFRIQEKDNQVSVHPFEIVFFRRVDLP